MSIKLLSPCPEDDGSASIRGKNFVAPKKKYNPINLSSMDFELEAAKLDVLDPTGKLNSLCRLTLTQGEAMSQVIKNQEILIESLVNTVNYTMMNDKFNQIMIGVSSNWDVREKNHKRKGWITLGARPGSLKQERMVKDVIKQFGIQPVPASSEIFLINSELINILISLQWVGVKQNKKRILTKDPQLNLDLNQDVR
tara:strand:+ start:738 stop:1328 length:591 start_codon:yes stop_codon:yes gene_type:complete